MPRRVEWKGKHGPQIHMLYTPEEAGQLGLVYNESWREGNVNDWVLTDDETIVQILSQGKDRKGRKWIRIPTGTFSCYRGQRLTTEDRQDRYSFSGKRTTGNVNLTVNLAVTCRFIAGGMDPIDAYMMVYPTKSPHYAKQRMKYLMSQKIVQQAITDDITNDLVAAGISREYILGKYKDIIDNSDNDAARVQCLHKLSELAQLVRDKVITNISAQAKITGEQLKELRQGDNYSKVDSEEVKDDSRKIESSSSPEPEGVEGQMVGP